MKRIIKTGKAVAVVSAFLYASLILTGTEAAETKSVNYGTVENTLYGEKGIAFIKVTDEDGNPVDSAEIYIADSSGRKLAAWNGNNLSTFRKISGKAELIDKKSAFDIYGTQFPDFSGGAGFNRATEVINEENGKTFISSTGIGRFKYGRTYLAETRYILYGKKEKSVPVNCFAVWADEKWKTRPVEWSFIIGEYDDPDDSFSSFTERQKFTANLIAGSLDMRSFPVGEYPYRIGYRLSHGGGGGGGNAYNRIVIEDPEKNIAEGKKSSWNYVKKTINLHDVYPSYFNEDGTVDKTFFDKKDRFSFAEDRLDPVRTAGLFFLSGNLVSIPIPDENGNVTLYVENETYRFSMMTDFGWGSGGGGGTTGMTGYPDEKAVYEINTVQIPEDAVPVRGLAEGGYTVKTDGVLGLYAPESASFTVSNADGSGVPECSMVMKHVKKHSLTAVKSSGGTFELKSDFTDDFSECPAGTPVKVLQNPDEGNRLKKIVFTYENGTEETGKSPCILAEETFEMPDDDVTVTLVFGKTVKGDVDGDDTLNAADAISMMKMILDSDTAYSDAGIEAADINGDGKVNVFDLIRLTKLVTGLQKQD